mgnify:CR=1 FL=1
MLPWLASSQLVAVVTLVLWLALAALRQQLLGAVNSLRLVGSRRALNAWAAMAAEVGAAKRQAAGALKSLSPEGRKMRAAWNSWHELAGERELLRKISKTAWTRYIEAELSDG